ncbi:hypothetical protein GCM10010218_27330 [Streptomyces mashuensis]|uniref:Polyketide cyclase n=1 Tax=Streptomyces mashuensis TaxID=33904 RepID=A0A919B3F0_9ACTN|nr:SRPBCC family protein [Streptomyces mashuensis]GHF44495.1 hypothetical protein GCM10010218_27330 [Streptomyces mashuensis]
METVTVRRVIDAPIAEVFDWCATTTHYTRSPFVLRARLARQGEGAPYGVGAVRLHTWLIGWFRERVTAYNPPYGFDYVVERSVPSARHELGRLTFTEVPEGTLVEWTTRFRPPLRCVAGPAKAVIAYVFGTILDAGAAELTRERMDPDGGGAHGRGGESGAGAGR